MTLREWLDGKRMAASEFADRIGVDRSSVGRWASGEVRPSWDLIPRIIEVTGGEVTANDFLPPADLDGGKADGEIAA